MSQIEARDRSASGHSSPVPIGEARLLKYFKDRSQTILCDLGRHSTVVLSVFKRFAPLSIVVGARLDVGINRIDLCLKSWRTDFLSSSPTRISPHAWTGSYETSAVKPSSILNCFVREVPGSAEHWLDRVSNENALQRGRWTTV
jgi:hypothetical protein